MRGLSLASLWKCVQWPFTDCLQAMLHPCRTASIPLSPPATRRAAADQVGLFRVA